MFRALTVPSNCSVDFAEALKIRPAWVLHRNGSFGNSGRDGNDDAAGSAASVFALGFKPVKGAFGLGVVITSSETKDFFLGGFTSLIPPSARISASSAGSTAVPTPRRKTSFAF